ncbi:2-succinyl-5-enolpyruvyl-6-hydroxy-3-cyclohexene-1-carboxylic-acid synthase [Flagellimonas allohymeniacidonis]|uniref:2-succinyl-5-enolpyruvyl-6-hydroxy-3-cyclohexene-1-carboxylate synthase n=1 Tax=Flagellimonas allohymeniacidonis TaxID=2517819 RepID=A0A4Q8QDT8_9FLAO|nr:2-succinyl-5-enolpyruvyl-6-hydroxy-3-cyclohexene-1-carboxylic-acid synthase [Allomuricauda hymeniacidonis]TAI48642.1 2-succinyl-5-enolpyruvyl-6-hydroxy-3-cyclohexene-1-carboxylic-acid synthase [Allomuricauda hymeniacidonis]
MIYSDIPSAQTLVLFFKSWGIKNIVISPGSRNAPLTLGFSKNSNFNCFSMVDERSAGFFALGMALQLQEPVAVLCTSGSALLNYYPAVCEAFYSDIPLIVVSADRPKYKIDVGDGQTIRQENVFANHIGYSANLKQDVSHFPETIQQFSPEMLMESQEDIQAYNEKEIQTALQVASTKRSPVHVNLPFEEPLYGQTKDLQITAPKFDQRDLVDVETEDYGTYASVWNSSKRKMILVGVNPPKSVNTEVLNKLAEDDSVVVFTETTSNLHHPDFFPSIDSIIAPIEKSANRQQLFENLRPDLLITFGGLIVSKKIKAFLRDFQPKQHWHVDKKKAFDTFFSLSEHIKTDANTFLRNLAVTKTGDQDYNPYWKKVRDAYELKREDYLEQIPFSDFWAMDQIQRAIPKGYQVHLSNSSTVRYSQLFPMNESLAVFCNRGASGIDGSTSTAIGASIYNDTPTILITGDLSFFYDSNGLWTNAARKDFRILVINNSGGGIFRILPGKEESEEFTTFFETTHSHKANHLARMYGFEYQNVSSKQELSSALKSFYNASENPKILEVFTPRLKNNKILLDYFDFIS